MTFENIVDLFSTIQSIRRKYPMVVSYLKHLQKISSDEQKAEEVEKFKRFILQNRAIDEKVLDEWYYYGTNKGAPIFFRNVISLGSEDVVEKFWTKLLAIQNELFPNGLPDPEPITPAKSSDAAANAMSVLEKDPLFSEVLDQVKSAVGNVSSPAEMIESPEFLQLVEKLGGGLQSGKYKLSDFSKTIRSVIETVQTDLDPEISGTLKTIVGMMSAAERGESPDVKKLMTMIGRMKNF